jgi:hypothetical protein
VQGRYQLRNFLVRRGSTQKIGLYVLLENEALAGVRRCGKRRKFSCQIRDWMWVPTKCSYDTDREWMSLLVQNGQRCPHFDGVLWLQPARQEPGSRKVQGTYIWQLFALMLWLPVFRYGSLYTQPV